MIRLTLAGLALPFDQPRHQVGKRQQISNPEQPAPLAHDDLRIGCHDVGPLPRHCADLVPVDAQQEPHPIPGVPLAHADELLSAERVKRVCDAYKARARVRNACSSS